MGSRRRLCEQLGDRARATGRAGGRPATAPGRGHAARRDGRHRARLWPLLLIGAVGFVPIWAVVAVLGESGLASVVQFLTIVPSAALLAAAGAIRADRRATLGGSYRHAIARLLDYFLANLVVGAIIVVIVVVPAIVIGVAIALIFVSGSQETSALVGVIVLMTLVALIPVTYVAGRLALVGPLVIVEGMGVGEAIAVGWRRTRRQVLRLLVVFVVGCIPGWLVALGLAMLGFGVFGIEAVSGAILGLGYAVADPRPVLRRRRGLAAPRWLAPDEPTRPARGPRRRATPAPSRRREPGAPDPRLGPGPADGHPVDRRRPGPRHRRLRGRGGKVGGWIEALGGRHEGTISYGVNGFGCFQLDPRSEFDAGQIVHLVAPFAPLAAGRSTGAVRGLCRRQADRRGFEAPFAERADCLFFDLDTTEIEPRDYTFRYLWGAELLAEARSRSGHEDAAASAIPRSAGGRAARRPGLAPGHVRVRRWRPDRHSRNPCQGRGLRRGGHLLRRDRGRGDPPDRGHRGADRRRDRRLHADQAGHRQRCRGRRRSGARQPMGVSGGKDSTTAWSSSSTWRPTASTAPFASSRRGLAGRWLSAGESQAIFDSVMLPQLREGNLDAALLAGLDAVDAQVTAGRRMEAGGRRVGNAMLGLIVAPIVALGLLGFVAMRWYGTARPGLHR